jgi:A/G-specific adenine glycosylase
MLQQTQVERVVEKYSIWLHKYPSLDDLRRASLSEVLIDWKGLGYQRRAKSLLAIALECDELPCEYQDLLALPGVGRYTASAVMSFAYNVNGFPLLETNIRAALVYSFFNDKGLVSDDSLYAVLHMLEMKKYPQDMGARVWYYALMDYGAHIKKIHGSQNEKSLHYRKQTTFKGSIRELRAKILYAIAEESETPEDERSDKVLSQLVKEGFITSTKDGYHIAK